MTRRALRTVLALSSLVAFSAAAACGSNKDAAPTGAAGNVVLAEGVTLLDAQRADDVEVLPGKLVMPKATHGDLATKKAGDVLVGDAGVTATTKNRWGFLRKVVSVREEAGNLVFETTQAEIGDVVQEGELSGTITVPSLLPDDPSAVAEPSLGTKGGKTIKVLDFSGKTLFSRTDSIEVQPGKTLGYEASVVLTKGTLDFTPTFDVGAKIKPSGFSLKGAVKEAHVIATGQLDAVAEIDASLKLIGTATGEDVAALIAKKIFGKPTTTIADHKIKLPGLKLGFISVPAHAQFTAVVTCDMKWGGETRVVVGGKASATIKAGARYDGSTISPVWEKSASLEKLGPTWTITNEMGLRCAIKPELKLNLWDVASGEILAEAYAALDAKATCNASKLTGDVTGSAYAGVNARAHAKLNVFGPYKWEKECTLFDLQSPVATFSGSFPLGSGATCTPTPDAPAPVPVSSPPASCFGDAKVGGGGEDAGVGPGLDGGTGEGGVDGDAGPVKCDHDVCTNGTPLTTGCTKDGQAGACIKAICENDPYCCEIAWSASCIDKVEKGMYGCTPRKCGG
ncbi:MAG: hypothetical protein HYV09_41190 [Deltaproteobacteria bacterium]|nr:hypothetical protein [Deltaproteobacteria bacterium]